jgi:ATP-dependent NAD(P)H-hydrate dehydratase
LAAIHLNVLCPLNVAPVIKSCSPEPIVHQILGAADALELIKSRLLRVHILIVGPGLGRDPDILENVGSISFAVANQIVENRL